MYAFICLYMAINLRGSGGGTERLEEKEGNWVNDVIMF